MVSSYKKHGLFSLIMVLPFFPDVFYLSLAFIAAAIIDMDYKITNRNLMIMTLSGILIFLIFYILKLPFLLGLVLITLSSIFYISKHRGIMHSFVGIVIISAFLTFFIWGLFILLGKYDMIFNLDNRIYLVIISIFLGIIILNKKLVLVFCILTAVGILMAPFPKLDVYNVFLAILLGSLSHIILDLFSPSGLKLFKPISSKKCKKVCGVALLILWGLFFVISFSFHGCF